MCMDLFICRVQTGCHKTHVIVVISLRYLLKFHVRDVFDAVLVTGGAGVANTVAHTGCLYFARKSVGREGNETQ